MGYQRRARGVVSDYMNVRTLPATLSVAFVAASLYQFGGVTSIELPWIDYALYGTHAMVISLGALIAAFASSETKQFENYERVEQALIAAGPAVIVGYEFFPAFADFLYSFGDPLGMQLAFVMTLVSWGVAVQ